MYSKLTTVLSSANKNSLVLTGVVLLQKSLNNTRGWIQAQQSAILLGNNLLYEGYDFRLLIFHMNATLLSSNW